MVFPGVDKPERCHILRLNTALPPPQAACIGGWHTFQCGHGAVSWIEPMSASSRLLVRAPSLEFRFQRQVCWYVCVPTSSVSLPFHRPNATRSVLGRGMFHPRATTKKQFVFLRVAETPMIRPEHGQSRCLIGWCPPLGAASLWLSGLPGVRPHMTGLAGVGPSRASLLVSEWKLRGTGDVSACCVPTHVWTYKTTRPTRVWSLRIPRLPCR